MFKEIQIAFAVLGGLQSILESLSADDDTPGEITIEELFSALMGSVSGALGVDSKSEAVIQWIDCTLNMLEEFDSNITNKSIKVVGE